MRKTYFASFTLGNGKPPSLEEIIALTKEWVEDPRKHIDPGLLKEIKLNESGDHIIGNNSSLFVRRHSAKDKEYFAVRMEHPDYKDDNLLWMAELCFAQDKLNNKMKTALTTSIGRIKEVLSPLPIMPSRPKLVKRLIEKFDAYEGSYPLSNKARRIGNEEIDSLVDFLKSKERGLPVVLVSTDNFSDKHLINPDVLADGLAGLAYIFAYKNRFQSFKLAERIGKSLGCYKGAIRIYWPGFSTADISYKHDIFMPWEVQERAKTIPKEILGDLSRLAVTRIPSYDLTWENIENKINNEKIEKLKNAGGSTEVLKLYEDQIEELNVKIINLSEQLNEANKEKEDYKAQVKSYKQMHSYVATRSPKAKEAEIALPPASIEEAVERIEDEFSNRIAFQLNSQSEVRNNPFKDIEKFYSALKFLATTYYESKSGEQSCPDLDTVCFEASGFRYEANQKWKTMKKYSNFYSIKWNDKKIWLEGHLTKSSTRDPRETIRVMFDYDKDSKKVVVGYIGQHANTDST